MSVISYGSLLTKHIFVRWKCHEFLPVEGVENQDKSALMNIDSLTRNANLKRLNVALPGDKLCTNFSELNYSILTKFSTGSLFSELKIN